MATNLRLSDELVEALRAESVRSGRSQQEIVRTAIARELGVAQTMTQMERAVRSGLVKPPAEFKDVIAAIPLPEGTTTLDLLDREER